MATTPVSLSLLSILFVLAGGYALGMMLPPTIRSGTARVLTPLIWLLLFTIGHEFGQVLHSTANIGRTLGTALVFAVATTMAPWCLIALFVKDENRNRPPGAVHASGITTATPVLANDVESGAIPALNAGTPSFVKPLKECLVALVMVAAGSALALSTTADSYAVTWLPSSAILLYLLIGLVGIDLRSVSIDRHWLSPHCLSVPALVIVGSLLAGATIAFVTGAPLSTALALSSGFGWFTLSSVIVGQQLGQVYGAIALMTDLFRELLAIILLYSVGSRFSLANIGAGGATTLDTTLPIVRQQCSVQALPVALVSGLLLSVAAPLLISLFLPGK